MDNYDVNIKNQTESAITLLHYAYSQYQSGELTEQQAITQQTTAASVQLTNNNMEDIAKNADELADLSEELNKLVLKFKL